MAIEDAYTKVVLAWHRLKLRSQEFKESNRGFEFSELHLKAQRATDRLCERTISSLNRRAGDPDGSRYSHIFRRKTRWELVRLSGAVCGIEFCYAAETAFVTPTLLGLGMPVSYVTFMWCLSPLIGFFLTPVLGSLSDRCTSRLGRRRPYIILLSVGIIFGLILVPNGKDIGIALGDRFDTPNGTVVNETVHTDSESNLHMHAWSIVFTVLGTVLLDFCSDACQSPSRTYLLDVTVPEDHATGLTTFTIMAGLGGSLGYAMGGIDWESTFLRAVMGNQLRTVFSLVAIVFVVFLSGTITSFREIPLDSLEPERPVTRPRSASAVGTHLYHSFSEDQNEDPPAEERRAPAVPKYGSTDTGKFLTVETKLMSVSVPDLRITDQDGLSVPDQQSMKRDVKTWEDTSSAIQTHISKEANVITPPPEAASPTLKHYLKSIIHMPKSLRILCLTNLFCWMSLVCYSLYFTDFVGEAVFGGDPQAPPGSPALQEYRVGVRFGCWGMAVYSISCSGYSLLIGKLVDRWGAEVVYIGGQVIYSCGMVLMASLRHYVAVILLSTTAGVMYATLFTMPYLLIAHYHSRGMFEVPSSNPRQKQVRGMGTDVAVVGSMVFLAQFILSSCMGSIVNAIGSTTATVYGASILSFCGAICATQVMYLDL